MFIGWLRDCPVPQHGKLLEQVKQPFLVPNQSPLLSPSSLSLVLVSVEGWARPTLPLLVLEGSLCAGVMQTLSLSLANLLGQGSFLLLGEIYSGLSLSELEALLDQGHWAHSGFGRRGLGRSWEVRSWFLF